MQTDGDNGGHRHEVFGKASSTRTFPCRLDMELCACGAKRWVDLQGRPATPWQFLNLRRPGGDSEG